MTFPDLTDEFDPRGMNVRPAHLLRVNQQQPKHVGGTRAGLDMTYADLEFNPRGTNVLPTPLLGINQQQLKHSRERRAAQDTKDSDLSDEFGPRGTNVRHTPLLCVNQHKPKHLVESRAAQNMKYLDLSDEFDPRGTNVPATLILCARKQQPKHLVGSRAAQHMKYPDLSAEFDRRETNLNVASTPLLCTRKQPKHMDESRASNMKYPYPIDEFDPRETNVSVCLKQLNETRAATAMKYLDVSDEIDARQPKHLHELRSMPDDNRDIIYPSMYEAEEEHLCPGYFYLDEEALLVSISPFKAENTSLMLHVRSTPPNKKSRRAPRRVAESKRGRPCHSSHTTISLKHKFLHLSRAIFCSSKYMSISR